jgi:CRISPR-associated endoribonuclease Cas6
MSLLDSDYAAVLHESKLHPYAQYISREEDGSCYWVVNCSNEGAAKNIIPVLMNQESIFLEKLNAKIMLSDRAYNEISYETLSSLFYGEALPRFIEIRFLTPASFKSDGEYCFFPDIRKIYKSMMNKYDTAMKDSNSSVFDTETLDELCQQSRITRYNLRSRLFPVEGVTIPSFTGTLTLKISGSQTLINFAHMLFRFAEYSGIGIKTSMGMGAIRIEKEKFNGGMKHGLD